MNLKKIKVYHLFWIVSVLIILIGLVLNNDPNSIFDINIHDTYFVISNYHISIILFLFYFLTGFGYWIIQKVFKKQLVQFLTISHSIILIGSFILYWIIYFCSARHQVNSNFSLYDDYLSINTVLVCEFFLIVFVATPIYIINLLIGIFRK